MADAELTASVVVVQEDLFRLMPTLLQAQEVEALAHQGPGHLGPGVPAGLGLDLEAWLPASPGLMDLDHAGDRAERRLHRRRLAARPPAALRRPADDVRLSGVSSATTRPLLMITTRPQVMGDLGQDVEWRGITVLLAQT